MKGLSSKENLHIVILSVVTTVPPPLENSAKQVPKLDFFPQAVSVLVFPSTSLTKAENTLEVNNRKSQHSFFFQSSIGTNVDQCMTAGWEIATRESPLKLTVCLWVNKLRPSPLTLVANTGLDKNQNLSLPFVQPALQFYPPETILN